MGRIRSLRPEYWDHPGIGRLSRDARLLFPATWNLADDEGLLRWSAPYIQTSVFRYDTDLSTEDVRRLMVELERGGYIHPYWGGEELAWIPKFRVHQKPNRPQRSRITPPDITDEAVRDLYGERAGWGCARCGGQLAPGSVVPFLVVSRLSGGTAHPTNVAVAHEECVPGSGSGARTDSLSDSVNEQRLSTELSPKSVDETPNHSVNDSVNRSVAEGRGEGGEMEGRAAPARSCPQHPHGTPNPCRACMDARLAHDHWQTTEADRAAAHRSDIRACSYCDGEGSRYEDGRRIPMAPKTRCDHRPLRSVS